MNGVRALGLPLAAGIAVRELLAPWTGHFDFEVWVRLGAWVGSGGSPYALLPSAGGLSFFPDSVVTSISYPPLPAFIFALTHWLYLLAGSPSRFLYYFLLKQPMVISDVAVALLLYMLLSKGGEQESARRAASLWLFFPFAIVVSSMWGALDPVALALILGAVYLLRSGRPELSAVALGCAIYLKLMPVIFLPVILLEPGVGGRRKAAYAAVSLAIPAVGTLVPLLLLNWNPANLLAAGAYQADLPLSGGMSVFSALAMFPLPTAGAQALGLLWVPALLAGYAYIRRKKAELVQGLLITVLIFSISRVATPEQWAVYPLAFLLILPGKESRARFLSVAAVATAFLLVNNFLLVRFFAPVSTAALNWDAFVDNASVLTDVRYAAMVGISTLFFAEAIYIIRGKGSFLAAKARDIISLAPRRVAAYSAYLAAVAISGAMLDYSVTSMVTDWNLAMESRVVLGLSWLSVYHLMLVAVFELIAVIAAISAREGPLGSARLLIVLTALNVGAAGASLLLFRVLQGSQVYSLVPIYLIGGTQVTERFFVTMTMLISAVGVFFSAELGSLVLAITGMGRRRTGAGSAG